MLNIDQYEAHIVVPALKKMEMYSPSAVDLIVGTALQESRLVYIKQLKGPALGLMQIEPRTLYDIYDNYLRYRPDIKARLNSFVHWNEAFDRSWPYLEHQLMSNMLYGVAVARIIYWRDKEPLPATLEGQAAFWKRVYNTPLGAGTEEEYINVWNKYRNQKPQWELEPVNKGYTKEEE